MHFLSFLVAWLALLAPAQQSKAKVEFFARADGNEVRGVVRIKVALGWHLYGHEIGENAIGKPTTLTFSGEGVRWGEPLFPPTEIETQPIGDDGTNPGRANIYHGTVVIYVAGQLEEGGKLETAEVQIVGQTCEDEGVCVPYQDSARVTVGGSDALFEKFPAELTLARAPPGDVGAVAAAADGFEPFTDPEAHAKVELFTREQDGEARAALRIAIDKEWHLFHRELGPPDAIGQKTEVTLGGAGIEWGDVIWPEPHKVDTPYGYDGKPTWILQHEGTIVLYARGKLAAGADVAKANVTVTGQTCTDVCTQLEARVLSSGKGPDELFAKFPAASASAKPAGSSPLEPAKESKGLIEFLGLAVFWGVFSLLMPCTYPMIPITISFFTKQASQESGKRITLSALYGLGIVLMFILIGVVIGAPIIRFAVHPLTNLIIGGFFVLFGLSLLGLFNLQPPAFLMNMAGQARMTGGYLGVFFMGATLVITSFTCTAPFVGSLLAAGATSGNIGRIVLGMGTFGLTMALPFVALSLVPGKLKAMPRSGEWMNTLKVTLGFVELAAALKFISNADLVYGWQALSREVFLILWFGIMMVAALYLLGLIRYHGETGEIGGGRLISGTLFFCFSLYCLFGALGNQLDFVMTALAPPYSSQRVIGYESGAGGGSDVARKDHEIVIDDLDAAVAKAAEQKKLVLVNFTGHT